MVETLRVAVDIAREAGELTLGYFRSGAFEVDEKADGSPVTAADRAAEELLRERLSAAFPADGILGEESGETAGTSGRTWILDPIDGTKSFARGVPLYGTLVGLEEDGEAVLGVACLPALGEVIYAARGAGAFRETAEGTRPARVSAVDRPEDALFCYTSVRGFARAGMLDLFERARGAFGLDRGFPDCYGHLLVATGRAEVMIDPFVSVWDVTALLPIVEEAGGRFGALDGETTHRGGSAVSTNAALRDAVRDLVGAGPGSGSGSGPSRST